MKNLIFNSPPITNIKNFNIKKAFNTNNFISNGYFHTKCVNLIKNKFKSKYIFY